MQMIDNLTCMKSENPWRARGFYFLYFRMINLSYFRRMALLVVLWWL